MVMINIASIHYFSGANLDTDFDADGVPTRPEHGNALLQSSTKIMIILPSDTECLSFDLACFFQNYASNIIFFVIFHSQKVTESFHFIS